MQNKELSLSLLENESPEVLTLLVAIALELRETKQKHPRWPQDMVHACAIISKEAGEMMKATLEWAYGEEKFFHIHKEGIQTAAMCLRFLETFTHHFEAHPAKPGHAKYWKSQTVRPTF